MVGPPFNLSVQQLEQRERPMAQQPEEVAQSTPSLHHLKRGPAGRDEHLVVGSFVGLVFPMPKLLR